MYMMCIIHSLKSVHTYMYVMILHVVLGCVELIYNIVYSLINTCSRVSYRREGISPPSLTNNPHYNYPFYFSVKDLKVKLVQENSYITIVQN